MTSPIQPRASERGQVLIFAAISMVMLFGMAAFAIDISQAVYTRRALQASSDAAALAGAQLLPDEAAAKAAAIAYSGVSRGKNARAGQAPVFMVSGYPQTKCLVSTGIPCIPSWNAIVVRQQSTVSTYFARILGVSSLTVYATATATMKGGAPNALDLIVILDTTASMNSDCSASVRGVPNPTRLDCALAGVRALVSSMWPCPPSEPTCGAVVNGNVAKPLDKIGLMIFPGLTQRSAINKEFDCFDNVPGNIAGYAASPFYTIVPLSSDYRVSTTATLNGAGSNLVQAVDWGHGNSCGSDRYGVESPGGVGTYFADVITQAQSQLTANGRTDVQDAIILLSDGDSNYSGVSNPCRQAVMAAQSAKDVGTWIYSIAYGASTSSGTCSRDSPVISSYTTMQQIASDSAKFFNQPTAGDLTTIFEHIVIDLTNSRLVPDNTP